MRILRITTRKPSFSGSYGRDTAIRPRVKDGQTDRPDLDIIVVTSHTSDDAPKDVVDLLFKTLQKKYPDIRRQDRSVGIKSSKADMDVVPIIPCGPMYLIPDRKQEEWAPNESGPDTQHGRHGLILLLMVASNLW